MATNSRTSRNLSTGVAWHRSLYWRIAIAFVLFLVGTLGTQAALLLWFVTRANFQNGPLAPAPYIKRIAAELSAVLSDHADIDPIAYLHATYANTASAYPLFMVLEDGRVASTGSWPPPFFRDVLRRQLEDASEGPFMLRTVGPPDPPKWAPVIAVGEIRQGGRLVGLVSAAGPTVLERLGWTAAGVGLGLAVIETGLVSLFVFGPVRRRVRDLAEAARQIGEGNLSVRAIEQGHDEVAELARTFNLMASTCSLALIRRLPPSGRAGCCWPMSPMNCAPPSRR